VKEVGTAYWACKSCLSFAAKMNMLLKNMNSQLVAMDSRITQNTTEIASTRKDLEKTEVGLKRVEKQVEDVKKQVEEEMYEEMREREMKKLNLVIHGVEEQEDGGENRERAEKDKDTCCQIFSAIDVGVRKDQVKFCRRIGERARDPRPIVIGFTSEEPRRKILERARDLKRTRFEKVNVVADLTRRQRQEESKMVEEAERKNRNLTEDDRSKYLKWMVVGRKGEKRLIKGVDRGPPEARRRESGGWNQRGHLSREDYSRSGRHGEEERYPRSQENNQREHHRSHSPREYGRSYYRERTRSRSRSRSRSPHHRNRGEDQHRRENRSEKSQDPRPSTHHNRPPQDRNTSKRGRATGTDSEPENGQPSAKTTKQ